MKLKVSDREDFLEHTETLLPDEKLSTLLLMWIVLKWLMGNSSTRAGRTHTHPVSVNTFDLCEVVGPLCYVTCLRQINESKCEINNLSIQTVCIFLGTNFWKRHMQQLQKEMPSSQLPLMTPAYNTSDDWWHMSSSRPDKQPDWSGSCSVQVWSIEDSWWSPPLPLRIGWGWAIGIQVTHTAVTSCWTQWKCAPAPRTWTCWAC